MDGEAKGGGRMTSQYRQIGFQAMCTHNPKMETCCVTGCETILFGEVFILQITDSKDEVQTWEMCSAQCYSKMDQFIEAAMEAADDWLATVDNGIPEQWFKGEEE